MPRNLNTGDLVEFVTNYPGHEGEIARGEVIDVGTLVHPRNPCVLTQHGQTEILDAWAVPGGTVRVVERAL